VAEIESVRVQEEMVAKREREREREISKKE
jgi:hypothetical protein